jgi:chemotaxis signal transduction protein
MANLKILTFMIRDRYFALPSANIKEIMDLADSLKDVFYNRGGALKGLMTYETDMISILDTPFLLDVEENTEKEYIEPLVLVCRGAHDDKPVGITISSIVGMEIIDDTDLKHSQDEEASYTYGFLKEGSGDDERVVTIIDFKKFLDFTNNIITRVTATGIDKTITPQ